MVWLTITIFSSFATLVNKFARRSVTLTVVTILGARVVPVEVSFVETCPVAGRAMLCTIYLLRNDHVAGHPFGCLELLRGSLIVDPLLSLGGEPAGVIR